MSTLDGRLTSLVVHVLEVSPAEAGAASADTIPAWDSLAHLRLLMAVEEEYGVRFSPAEIAELDSVKRIGDALERLVSLRGSA